nr:e3 ubiquitin-protein ligase atl31 [Quercus suber]
MFSNSEESDQAEKQMKRALKRLSPISGYKSDQQETASWNEYCVICLEEFQPGDPCQRFPFCKHIFHSHCIRHWLKFQLTCPICRTIVDLHESAHVDLHANGVNTIV